MIASFHNRGEEITSVQLERVPLRGDLCSFENVPGKWRVTEVEHFFAKGSQGTICHVDKVFVVPGREGSL